MKNLFLLAVPTLALATPALSADLYYRDSSGVVIEQPVVERERIIERRYYAPAPVVRERVVVDPPRVYYAPPRRGYYTAGYGTYGYGPAHYGYEPVWGYSRWYRPYRW